MATTHRSQNIEHSLPSGWQACPSRQPHSSVAEPQLVQQVFATYLCPFNLKDRSRMGEVSIMYYIMICIVLVREYLYLKAWQVESVWSARIVGG